MTCYKNVTVNTIENQLILCFIDSSVVSSVFGLNRYKSLSVVTCYKEFRTFTSPTCYKYLLVTLRAFDCIIS